MQSNSIILKVSGCPTDELSLTNRALVLRGQIPDQVRYVVVIKIVKDRDGNIQEVDNQPTTIFTLQQLDKFEGGKIGFNYNSRLWASLSIDQDVVVRPYSIDSKRQYISKIVFKVDFHIKNNTTPEPYDTDVMAKEFTMQFAQHAFTKGQNIGFKFGNKKLLSCICSEIEALHVDEKTTDGTTEKVNFGVLAANSAVIFEKKEGAFINLTGKSKGKVQQQSIINPNWNFEKLGIGGLDKEFSTIFRRAFASRVLPIEIIEQLDIKHVRGILLYGPPGTGKTLIARQIGKMLNAREPKIVNGPDILNKYVGESEANIRRLFEDAEVEFKRVGNNSALHMIIFDEIDAICKQRGSVAGASGVHDTVVNQLLSKLDGVESLNNILVIGMTNRKDMIDDALLRPGRLEVQLEISLPDEFGRQQILLIHTTSLRKYNKLATDVNLKELAKLSSNFSGAELEGLVRAAESTAINKLVKASQSSKAEVDPDVYSKLTVNREDFMVALENDIKPAFGTSAEEIESVIRNGIIHWGEFMDLISQESEIFINQVKNPKTSSTVTVLLEGAAKTGKTSLAAKIALDSQFPFVKICSPEAMVGYTEQAKCQIIRKMFDDAYKSPLSCLIIDDIERLIDYAPVGPRFSNLVLQALLVLLKKQPPKGKNLLVLCTTSEKDILEQLKLPAVFTKRIHCSLLTTPVHLMNVLNSICDGSEPAFTKQQRDTIAQRIANINIHVGIKQLMDAIQNANEVTPEFRVNKFLCNLEEDNSIGMKRF